MVREYLYRGKRTDKAEWVKGDLIHGVSTRSGKMYILPTVSNLAYLEGCDPLDGYNVIPDSVGPFIGLTDKNGTKIFDGDIISVNGVVNFAVKYIEERLSFCLANTDELKLNLKCMSPWHPVSASWWNEFGREIEVIDNIHDNPELIK